VVAVCAQDGLFDVPHLASKCLDKQAVLFRGAIPNGVRKIDRAGTGVDHGFRHRGEEVDIRSPGIFGRELDVVAQRSRVANAFNSAGKRFFASLVQFVFEVNITGGKKDVDAGLVVSFEGLSAAVDIFLYASRQTRNNRRPYLGGYAAHSLEVS